jgi:FlaA1/EpsC-like NDP-sugar epimerase
VIVYSRDELKQSDMQMELREQFDEATYARCASSWATCAIASA